MKLLIVSGSSGSGKSAALQVLEDLEYHCIDNLPLDLLPQLLDVACSTEKETRKIAVSVDARNLTPRFQDLMEDLGRIRQREDTIIELLYLDAEPNILLKRFSATRRRHPLSNKSVSLLEAIAHEKNLLSSLASMADLRIDTSNLNINELKAILQKRLGSKSESEFSLMFESFSYRTGVPLDADYVFDVRCLPNPHWISELKELTGQDEAVQTFLNKEPIVEQMLQQLSAFLDAWLPAFIDNNRRYMTVAIGCTGGQHRSVYIAETLTGMFKPKYQQVLVRHRELHHIQSA